METTDSQTTYEGPTVVSMGSLVSMTLAGHNQPFLDASFSAGTPLSAITTS
jgi:hypothetical protein